MNAKRQKIYKIIFVLTLVLSLCLQVLPEARAQQSTPAFNVSTAYVLSHLIQIHLAAHPLGQPYRNDIFDWMNYYLVPNADPITTQMPYDHPFFHAYGGFWGVYSKTVFSNFAAAFQQPVNPNDVILYRTPSSGFFVRQGDCILGFDIYDWPFGAGDYGMDPNLHRVTATEWDDIAAEVNAQFISHQHGDHFSTGFSMAMVNHYFSSNGAEHKTFVTPDHKSLITDFVQTSNIPGMAELDQAIYIPSYGAPETFCNGNAEVYSILGQQVAPAAQDNIYLIKMGNGSNARYLMQWGDHSLNTQGAIPNIINFIFNNVWQTSSVDYAQNVSLTPGSDGAQVNASLNILHHAAPYMEWFHWGSFAANGEHLFFPVTGTQRLMAGEIYVLP